MTSAFRCFHCQRIVAEGARHNCVARSRAVHLNADTLDPPEPGLLARFVRWLKGPPPRPAYTVRHRSPAEYLASREAGRNMVRVEGQVRP